MTRDHCVLIGRTPSIPVAASEGENEIIYCLEDIDNAKELEYLVTIVYCAVQFVKSDIDYIKSEWFELVKAPIEVELLECNRRKITKPYRELFDRHTDNEVLFKAPFLAFARSSEKAYQAAKELVKNSALKKTWEVWK